MATIAYIFQSTAIENLDEDKAWMESFGYDRLITEDPIHEKLRPEWRKMLSNIKKNDTIIVTKLSHALRGIRQFGALLDLVTQYDLRLISIEDKLDNHNELFPDTTLSDFFSVLSTLTNEALKLRKAEGRAVRLRKEIRPRTLKAQLKLDREKTIINMYNSNHSIDDIWKVSGYKSRTSVFRVLNRNGVQLNRRGTAER